MDEQRCLDLLRYARGYLFEENLVTQEEYTSLLLHEGAVPRLEGYDFLRADLARVMTERDALAVVVDQYVEALDDIRLNSEDDESRETAETAINGCGPESPEYLAILAARDAEQRKAGAVGWIRKHAQTFDAGPIRNQWEKYADDLENGEVKP